MRLPILLLLILTAKVYAQENYTPKEFLKEQIPSSIVGMGIALIDGNNVYQVHHGTYDANKRMPVTENTLFEIGSVTKTFNGSLLAGMHLKGLLHLNDFVDDAIAPELSFNNQMKNSVRFWHLATNTSGLPRNMAPGLEGVTFEEMQKRLKKWVAPFDPGDGYQYSNTGNQLLNYALTRVAGKSYDELLQEYLARPLKMKSTYIVIPSEKEKLLSKGFQENGKLVYMPEREPWNGIGVIKSTLSDMTKFVQGLAGIRSSSADGLFSVVNQTHFERRSSNLGLGHGMREGYFLDTRYFLHNKNGGTPISSTYIAWIPELKIGIVILSNTKYKVSSLGKDIIDEYLSLKENLVF